MLILAMMLSVMSVNAQFVEYKPVYTNPRAPAIFCAIIWLGDAADASAYGGIY